MNDSRKWYWLALTLLAGVLLYLLAPVLTPFLVAALLAYMGNPLVNFLERHRLSRTGAVVVVFAALSLVLVVLLLIFVPLLERQIVLLATKLPGYIDWLQQNALPAASNWLGIELGSFDLASLKEMVANQLKAVGGVAAAVWKAVAHSGMTLLGWFANLLLIPVVTFYLLRDWKLLLERIHLLLPRPFEAVVARLARQSDEVLGSFFRGQLLVMLSLATVYSTGLWFVGLDLALLIGMVAGLVSFVPYLGFIIGIVMASIAALMQFHEALPLLYVAIVFMVGQALEGVVLTPWLVGEKIGLHPVAVIFAVLAGGQLFGFFGVLLALPAAAVIVVVLRYLLERYLGSELYVESKKQKAVTR
ncbi:MAG TPA: AI-2E family transporter [Gammaproteobacteria bacterium]